MTGTEVPTRPTPGSADVRLAPGAYYLSGLAVGFSADRFISIPFPVPAWASTAVGAIALAAGLGFVAAGLISLRRAGTPISPMKTTTVLLTSGVYGVSRHPAYLGLTLGYAGIALLGRSIGSMVLLPCVVAIFQRQVIRREEKYLREVFGAAYEKYSARVRRWL